MKISIAEKDAKKRQCHWFGAPEPDDIELNKIVTADPTSYRPCVTSRCMSWRETVKNEGVCLSMIGHAAVFELFKAEKLPDKK